MHDQRSARKVVLLLLLPALLCGCGAERDATTPNIVLILADDLGYGDPSHANPASKIPTPHMDRLAREGLRLTDAHSPSAVCSPTRYALLTGRYAWRTQLKQGVLWGDSPLLVETDRPTMASVLAGRGYRTACIGKWHLGFGDATPVDYTKPLRPGPLDVGFDEFFGIPASLDIPPYVYVRGDRPVEPPAETTAGSELRRFDGGGFWRAGATSVSFRHEEVLPRTTEEATAFIERGAADPETPFFLYFALTAPHTPWLPGEEHLGASGAGFYGDFVAHIDACIGQVLDALDENGLAENTIVVFTSDNGAHWMPTDIQQYEHRANLDWRGQKADIWEGGHRVPFLIRWPDKIAASSTRGQAVCLSDLFATFAAIAGAEIPEDAGEDSFDLSPLLFREPEDFERPPVVHHSFDGVFALRQDRWKLIEGLGSGGFTPPSLIEATPDGPKGQLYDLRDDPAETKNLYLEQPDLVRELSARLDAIRNGGRSR